MGSTGGVFQHTQATGQTLSTLTASPTAASPSTGGTKTSATSSSNSTTSSSSTSAATITANDFLSLLVTELKNQDPTATSDPNEYVNQLCEVNSLEQLVSINSTLTKDLGSSTTSSGGGTKGKVTPASSGTSATDATSSSATAQARTAYHANALATQSATASGNSATGVLSSAVSKTAPGNLSVPETNSSALRVAQSLSGQTHQY